MQLLLTTLIWLLAALPVVCFKKTCSSESGDLLQSLKRMIFDRDRDMLLQCLGFCETDQFPHEAPELLMLTTKIGDLEMTKILISHLNIQKSVVESIFKERFLPLCEAKIIDVIEFIISEYTEAVTEDLFDESISLSIELNSAELIRILTSFKDVSPKAILHVLRSAAKLGSVEIFQLIAGQPLHVPKAHLRVCFAIACENGHEALVSWLIEAGVDPSTSRNQGLLAANSNGHLQVVKNLLKFEGVKEKLELRKLCHVAINRDDAKTFEYYLTNFEIKPFQLDVFLRKTCQKDHPKCLTVLLKKMVPPKSVLNFAISESSYKAIRVILKDARVEPTQQLFRDACEAKDFKLMKLFIEDRRIDPSVDNCLALNLLVRHSLANTNKTLRSLIRDSRIQQHLDDAVRVAVNKRNLDAALILYAHPCVTIRKVIACEMQELLDACKTGRLFDVVGEFSDIPLHFLEFIVRGSLSHGHVYAFKFGLEELLEEFLINSEDLNEDAAERALYDIAETIDYCIFWIISDSSHSNLLHYLGTTIHKYECLSSLKKFPTVSALHYIFSVHVVLLEIFRKMDLQDVASIILNYHLTEFNLMYKK